MREEWRDKYWRSKQELKKERVSDTQAGAGEKGMVRDGFLEVHQW